MQGKIFGYSAVYFLAFCFFTLVFHTLAAAYSEPLYNESKQINDYQAQSRLSIVPNSPAPTATPTSTPTPTPAPEPTAIPTLVPTTIPTTVPIVNSPGDLEGWFQKYSDEYHADKELLKRIANCESGFNPSADTGIYAGMFQFAAQTWITARSGMGLDSNPELRKNAEESIRTAAYMVSRGQQNAWANCLH